MAVARLGPALAGATAYLLGGYDTALTVLLIVMILDVFGAVLVMQDRRTWDSTALRKLATRKVALLAMGVGLAVQMDRLWGGPDDASLFRPAAIALYVATEAASCLKRLDDLGLPVLSRMVDWLAQVRRDTAGPGGGPGR